MYPMIRRGELKALRASSTLPASGAWDNAASAEVLPTPGDSDVSFFAEYTLGGSGGAAELRFEGSPVGSGDDWHPLEEVLDTAAASLTGQALTVPVRVASMKLIGTQKAPVHTLRLGGVERVRVLAREVGNTGAPGTLIVRARGITQGGV
jgi:hypothetical protein